MLRKISRQQVKLGMFIHAFEGPWIDHPFWLPRFLLTQVNDIDRILGSSVPGVIIDESRGTHLDADVDQATVLASPQHGQSTEEPLTLPQSLLAAQASVSFANEKERAAKLVKHSTMEMTRLFAAAHAGEGLQLTKFVALAAEVMLSVSRNPYALIAITRLKKRDEYTYVHSLAVSALMTSFARTLGLSEQDAFELGLAGLLHDIGKIIVPEYILQKPDSLSDEEFALVRTHPEQGYLLLSQNPLTPAVILDVCRHHHERLDGSGYPFRLKSDAISRAAQIAAICDVYDALTSNRSYKEAWTSEDAICRMYEWTGHFDRKLLFFFMKTIGVYPPRLLVQLRSNRLGMTMPNDRRASRPKVRVFYDSRNRMQLPIEDIVIADDLSQDQIVNEQYPLDWGFADWPTIAQQILKGTPPFGKGGIA